jgi:molybdate transport system substrate-binding protein
VTFKPAGNAGGNNARREEPMRNAIRVTSLIALMLLSARIAVAAEIKVLAVGALGTGLKAIAADFTKETGTAVNLILTNPTALNQALAANKPIESINSDQPVDVIVAAASSMEDFDKKGAFKPGSRVALLRVGIGVGIKEGAKKPDLTTPEAFKQAMLSAKVVTYGDPSQANGSGINVQQVLQKAGVWDAVKAKGRMEGLGQAKELIAKGDADLGLFNASETAGPGVVLAGSAPQSLQAYTTYAAAIAAKAPSADQAASFVKFMAGAKDSWQKAHVEMAAK